MSTLLYPLNLELQKCAFCFWKELIVHVRAHTFSLVHFLRLYYKVLSFVIIFYATWNAPSGFKWLLNHFEMCYIRKCDLGWQNFKWRTAKPVTHDWFFLTDSILWDNWMLTKLIYQEKEKIRGTFSLFLISCIKLCGISWHVNHICDSLGSSSILVQEDGQDRHRLE